MVFSALPLHSLLEQDEQDDLAAQWLDLVVAGAGGAYADAITRIPDLTPQASCCNALHAHFSISTCERCEKQHVHCILWL